MAFDPTSAQPATTGFDPTSAQPLSAPTGGFDPTSAQPVKFGDQYGGGLWGGIQQVAHGMEGAYQSAVTNGLLMQPVRQVMESAGYGMGELKQRFPGQTDEWYQKTLHQAYNNAVTMSRQNAQQETQANPYPGQTVGNFVAGAVGSPENLLMGGEGAGATVVGRIANAALKNAGIGSLSDAAAQGMDMLEGQKKNFDVTQNLQAAAGAGLIGGAMHGAVEATPFVKSLFGQRGIDTTPGADPSAEVTKPTTDQQIAMNAEDHQKYMNLLNTGSVDDIKRFVEGRQGPQPSWQDVNAWVEHRDNLASQGVNAKMTNPDFNYENEYNRQTIQAHVDDQTSGWKNAPNYTVVHGPEDIQDPQVQQAVMAAGGNDPNKLGVFNPDGSATLFSGRIKDAADATGQSPGELTNSVLFHEGLGHYGLQQAFGDRLDTTIQTLLKRNVGQFGRDVTAWQKSHPGEYGGDRIRAAEEVLANYSNQGIVKPSIADAIGGVVNRFGRKLGLKLSYSDAEVMNIVRMAQQAVTDGVGRDVRGNGYKFMFTGPSAAGFDPESPTAFTASDGLRRNEISDENSIVHAIPQGASKLGDVLTHPRLFGNYPELKNLDVYKTDLRDQGLVGAYDNNNKQILIHNGDLSGHSEKSVLLHEVQHAIQDREGLMKPGEVGTATATPEDYTADPREREALSTEDRLSMPLTARIVNPVRFADLTDIVPSRKSDEDLVKAINENYVKDTRTLPEIQRAAYDLGVSPSDVKNLKQHQLSVLVNRLGTAGTNALDRIDMLDKRIGTSQETVADRFAYLKTIADLNKILPAYKSNVSEAARALRVSQAFEHFTDGGIQAVVERLAAEDSGLAGLAEDPEKFYLFQKQIKELLARGNPKGALVKLQQVDKPYWEQYVNTFHFNAMLSSLATQFKAMRDMTQGLAHETIDRALAVPVAYGRNVYEKATGKPVVPGVHPTEVLADLNGLFHSVVDLETYKATLHAAMTGESSYVRSGQRVPTNAIGQYTGRGAGAIPDPHVPGISIPTQLISAHDTLFRSVGMMKNLYALGTREAVDNGYKGFDVYHAAAGYARNPTLSMLNEAKDLTNRALLLNSNPLNSVLDKARINTPGQSGASRLGTFIIRNLAPFIRVESNALLTRVIQRSPFALLDPFTRQEINAGGRRSDMAMSKILYGTIKFGVYWAAAGFGDKLITGQGSNNVDKYKEQLAAGVTPNSVKLGNEYVRPDLPMSLNPFDLNNSTAVMVKNARDAWETGAKSNNWGMASVLALGAVIHELATSSWLNDLTPALDALTARGEDASQKFNQFAGSEAKTFVPGVVNKFTQMTEPAKDTRPNPIPGMPGVTNPMEAIGNSVMSGIPGNSLPVKTSVYGDPEQTGARLLVNGVTKTTTDPAELELQRLGNTDPDHALVTPVLRTIHVPDENGDSKPRQLTTKEFEEYQRVAGQDIVEKTRQAMQDPRWAQMSDQDKWDYIKAIQKDSKQAARESLFGAP